MDADPVILKAAALHPLAEVVAATGFSAEVLRAWQRRYGFPCPARDGTGRRLFSRQDVQRLRLLRKLIDQGERPARIVALPLAELQVRVCQSGGLAELPLHGLDADVAQALELVRNCQAHGLADHLQRCAASRGARDFVLNVARPFVSATGDAWHGGEIAIHQEHLATQVLQRLLASLALALRGFGESGPLAVLTTSPGEAHGLGLAMLEVILAHEGCRCVHLGQETPAAEVALAARRHGAAVVALSFSSFFKPARVVPAIGAVRDRLPPEVALWVGGANGGLALPLPDGVRRFTALEDVAGPVRQLLRR